MSDHHRAGAASTEATPRATTRMTLAQALIGSDLIRRLLEYSGTDDDPRDLAQSWAHRIADWIDQHDGWASTEAITCVWIEAATPSRHAAWCSLPVNHAGLCEGDQ